MAIGERLATDQPRSALLSSRQLIRLPYKTAYCYGRLMFEGLIAGHKTNGLLSQPRDLVMWLPQLFDWCPWACFTLLNAGRVFLLLS